MPELYYEVKAELQLLNDYMDKVINRDSKVIEFTEDDRLLQPSCIDDVCEKVRNLQLWDLPSKDKVLVHNLSVMIERFKHKFSKINNEEYWRSYNCYEGISRRKSRNLRT